MTSYQIKCMYILKQFKIITVSFSYFYVRFELKSSFDSIILSWGKKYECPSVNCWPLSPLIMHSCIFFDASLALLSAVVKILPLDTSQAWSLSWPNYTYYQSIFITLTRCLECYIKPYRVPKLCMTNVHVGSLTRTRELCISCTYFCVFFPLIYALTHKIFLYLQLCWTNRNHLFIA